MDVLIKNMDMPKSCIDADTSHGCFCLLHCKVGREMVKKGKSLDGRPKDCPLVALPSHGDLKDETDIIHRIEKIADADLAQDIIGEILASPTIVEASNE